jgi:hypothetical protein
MGWCIAYSINTVMLEGDYIYEDSDIYKQQRKCS